MSIDYSNFAFPKAQKGIKNRKRKDISKTNREEIKKLFKGKRGLCGRQGQHIHHVLYRSEARDKIDDLDNLFLLCLECHEKCHSNKKYWQPILIEKRGKIK